MRGVRCAGARYGLLAASLLATAAASCERRSDHERIGDRRYAERSYTDATAEYRLAVRLGGQSAELYAKLALASLHAGALEDAANVYAQLAAAEPAASDEAADGLVRVTRAATQARDVVALRTAVTHLRRLAPLRLPVALARTGVAGLASQQDFRGLEGAEVLLAAAAGAPRTVVQDSLLVLWADVIGREGRCAEAGSAYAAVLRRQATTALARHARGGLATCALEAGRAALEVGALDSAIAAFAAAVAIGTPDSVVRTAWVLTGDAQWAAGDSTAAAAAYRKALERGDDTSAIVQRAREQLEKLLGGAPLP